MATKRLYTYQEVISAIYYDIIDLMGIEALDAKLTTYDLLAVMAAPCTRLDYDKTDPLKRNALMKAVHSFMMQNKRIASLTHQALVKELDRSFLPKLTSEQQMELLASFKMIMGFDTDGYAIFNPQFYHVYKGNMDKGHITRIRYASLSGQDASKGLPDKEITKTYKAQKTGKVFHLDLDLTVEDWKDILRGASVKAMQLIGAFSQMEDCTATHTEIEERFGILSETINGVTAGLGNRAKRLMGIEVLGVDGDPSCWILPFNNGREELCRGFVWELRPEVYKAFKALTDNAQ